MDTKIKQKKRDRRHKRVRAKIFGTAQRPRFYVFRSNQHIYAKLIDDEKGKTILGLSDIEFEKLKVKIKSLKKVAVAYEVGKLLAEKALKNKIKKVVFDRGGYKYHGRVKAVAEGARGAGLMF